MSGVHPVATGRLGHRTRNTKTQGNKNVSLFPKSDTVAKLREQHVHMHVCVCVCVHTLRLSTFHVIAVSRLQRQHQTRCVDVPGDLQSNPPAGLLTAAAALTTVTCQ